MNSKEKIVESSYADYKEELSHYFASNYDAILSSKIKNIELDSIEWLHTFYSNNKYTTIWINDSLRLSKDGVALINQLASSKNYGLDTRFYPINTLLEFKKMLSEIDKKDKYNLASRLELLLSYSYMLHGKHLNYGVLDSIDSLSVLPRKKFRIDLPKYLLEAHQSDSIILKLLKLQPKHNEYRNLQKGLTKFLKNSRLSTKSIDVINFRKDSLKAVELTKKALELHQYLPESYSDSVYFEALTKFQKDHGLKPDGLIGKNTAKALSLSPYEYYQKIVTALERWRWKEDWSSDYLFANIASYRLHWVKNEKLVKQYKTVVGKIKNPTPEIVDTLEYIIAYPFWNVPRRISVEEILLKAQKDSSYLTRNNYEVLNYSREELDPNTINWSEIDADSFNFMMRQKGGSSNSLGLVKFIFPNERAIYLHDTPSKYYFNLETRAYSHGCVRVHNALDLAASLLESDRNKYTIDSIYNYIEKQKEKPIRLNKKLPIYLYYFPAIADSLGNITFYDDIYGLDKKISQELAVKHQR